MKNRPLRYRKTLLATLLYGLAPLPDTLAGDLGPLTIEDGKAHRMSQSSINSQAFDQPAIILRQHGSSLLLTDSTVTTGGDYGVGIKLSDLTSLELVNSQITTSGREADGINMLNAAMLMEQSEITINGNASGLNLMGNSHVSVKNSVISSTQREGIKLSDSSTLLLNDSQIKVLGKTGKGLVATGDNPDAPSYFSADHLHVEVSGAQAQGIVLEGATEGRLVDSTVAMQAGTSALSLRNGAVLTAERLTVEVDNRAAGDTPVMELVDITGADVVLNQATFHAETQGTLDVFDVAGSSSRAGSLTLNDAHVSVTNSRTTLSTPSYLFYVGSGGEVEVNGGEFSISGPLGYGVWLTQPDAQMTATDMSLSTDGLQGHGIDNRGVMQLTESRVTTTGAFSHALYTEGQTTGENLTLAALGGNGAAVAVARGGDATLTGVEARAEGNNSNLLLNFGHSRIEATGLTGSASGNAAAAIRTYAYGDTALTHSQLRASGQDATGILQQNSAPGDGITSQITLDNSQISSESHAITSQGGGLNLALTHGSQLASDSGVLLDATALPATTSGNIPTNDAILLSASDHSQLLGEIKSDGASAISVDLRDGSLWQGSSLSAPTLAVDATSVWQVTGDSQLNALTLHGTLDFTPHSTGFTTVNIDGDLTGGGTLVMNSALGGNASPSDRLRVGGDMRGDYQLYVHNSGGAGGLTQGDGILLLEVDGQSEGSVTLGQRVAVDAYEYLLYQGGEQDANDWFLRSSLDDEPVPDDGGEPVPDDGDEPQPLPPDEIPWREEVPSYIAAPLLNQHYAFDALGTYHQRTGGDVAHLDGSWLRVFDQQQRWDAGRFGYDSETRYVQFGNDLYEQRDESQTTRAGWVVTLGSQRTDAEDRQRALNPALSIATGRLDSTIYSAGGYYTRQATDGSYVDVIGQFNSYRNDYFSASHAAQHGLGAALSAEAGRPFALGGDWALEPQLQLKYQYLHLDAFHDEISDVSGVANHSGEARAGLRLARDAGAFRPYLTLDATTLIGNEPPVRIGSQTLRAEFSNSSWQAGLGAAATLRPNLSAYGELRYQRAFDGDMDGYAGTLGIKATF